MIKLDNKNLSLMGDPHGIGWQFHRKLETLKDTNLIVLGDCGLGFNEPSVERADLNVINRICEKNNNTVFLMFGNHDDKTYFSKLRKDGHVTFLPDYSYLETPDDQKILAVGGGISIDRKNRILGLDYWEDESVQLLEEKIQPVDILLTHVPLSHLFGFGFGEPVASWAKRDANLIKDLKKEREILTHIFELCQPKKMFSGHLHHSLSIEYQGCQCRVLNIFEVFSIGCWEDSIVDKIPLDIGDKIGDSN